VPQFHYVILLQPYSFGHPRLEVRKQKIVARIAGGFYQVFLNISSLYGSVVSNINTELQDCLCWFMYSKM